MAKGKNLNLLDSHVLYNAILIFLECSYEDIFVLFEGDGWKIRRRPILPFVSTKFINENFIDIFNQKSINACQKLDEILLANENQPTVIDSMSFGSKTAMGTAIGKKAKQETEPIVKNFCFVCVS